MDEDGWEFCAYAVGDTGFKVGHATNLRPDSMTGCTVILCPQTGVTLASASYLGPAPGSRESELMSPAKPTGDVQAVVLTGGSAIGLGTADGVVRFLRQHNVGHYTPAGPVPLVPASVIFDLWWSRGLRVPTADIGYKAASLAFQQEGDQDDSGASSDFAGLRQGTVGAGTGAVVGKWNGGHGCMKGGFGMAESRHGNIRCTAFAVVNAIGDVCADDGAVIAGARNATNSGWQAANNPMRIRQQALSKGVSLRSVDNNIQNTDSAAAAADGQGEKADDDDDDRSGTSNITNTTLVVVATNGKLTKLELHLIACRVHDGMSRAIRPIHTRHDGDTAYCLSCGDQTVEVDVVGALAVDATARAIRNAVKSATDVPASELHEKYFNIPKGNLIPAANSL